MRSEAPQASRVPQLRQLWKDAFGDTEAFLDTFFACGFSPDRCRCIVEGDRVVSALYWFEGTCGGQRFAYLYAVATAEEARGRGLFRTLLAQTEQVLAARGYDGILLVPESEGLGRMYEKLGFSPCTRVDVYRAAAEDGPGAVCRALSAQEYMVLRRACLPRGAVLQEGDWLPFLDAQYRFYRGADFLAAGQVYDGEFYAQEFLGPKAAMAGLVTALGAKAGRFRCPGTGRPFAWLKKLHDGCGAPEYFALAMD